MNAKRNRTAYQRQWSSKNPEKVKAAQRRWVVKNPDKVRRKAQQASQRQADRLLRFKRMKGCFDCGLHDIRVLQFDHVPERGEKAFKLAEHRAKGRKKIREELAKCDVVCANCHAIRTWERRDAKA